MPFVAAAKTFAAVMLGTTLPTPLYPLYAREYRFGAATVTLIFAAYAVGVIAALLLVGRISDEVGRRPVLLPGCRVVSGERRALPGGAEHDCALSRARGVGAVRRHLRR
jgi:MFS family permease